MDPISQGIIGSTVTQSLQKNNDSLTILAIIGFLSGMAPDLDIFIRSESDPLLFLRISQAIHAFANFYSYRRPTLCFNILLVCQKI